MQTLPEAGYDVIERPVAARHLAGFPLYGRRLHLGTHEPFDAFPEPGPGRDSITRSQKQKPPVSLYNHCIETNLTPDRVIVASFR